MCVCCLPLRLVSCPFTSQLVSRLLPGIRTQRGARHCILTCATCAAPTAPGPLLLLLPPALLSQASAKMKKFQILLLNLHPIILPRDKILISRWLSRRRAGSGFPPLPWHAAGPRLRCGPVRSGLRCSLGSEAADTSLCFFPPDESH